MLTLKSFHLFFVGVSIVLTSGFGVWGLMNRFPALGASSLVLAVLLVVYLGYFVSKIETTT